MRDTSPDDLFPAAVAAIRVAARTAEVVRYSFPLCVVVAATLGCSGAPHTATPAPPPAADTTAHTVDPDAHFMTGMIHHHAQAILIAGWAESHGASDAARRLSERITVAQRDEIALMSTWLKQRNLPVPEAGMDHSVHMPGMLTADQLATLDQARGPDFDRLFLTLMIQHHKGAITMVEELLRSHGGSQDAFVFRLASDISAGQTAEINRMNGMLAAITRTPSQ